MDLGQVDAEHRVQRRADVEGRGVGLLRWCVRAGGNLPAGLSPALLQPLQNRFDPRIALRHLGLVDVVQLQGLGQGEDVLLAVVADQGLPDRLDRGVAARVAIGGQHVRVALAGHDGADDAHPGRARDVRDDVMELQVHLRQRLLHVLDVGGGVVQQPLALAQIGPQTRRSRPGAGSCPAAGHTRAGAAATGRR